MNGIVIINKEKSWTSHDVVNKVKKILNEKVGHTGTLDPNATGVLPLLIGEGTKFSKYIIEHDKVYKARLKLGEKRDTADSEGQVTNIKEIRDINDSKIIEVLTSFIGKQKQNPPQYSAIKINGKKLYEYARKGIQVEVEPRQIEIYNMKFLNYDINNQEIDFEVSCSKGTYIRSLCEDIAEKLNTVGYMKELNRLKVGNFEIKDAITIEEFEEHIKNNNFDDIITMNQFFSDKPRIDIEDRRLNHLLNGVKLTYKKPDGIYNLYSNNKYIGIGQVNNELLKREIIIF